MYGQALTRLININIERCRGLLETSSDLGTINQLQGEIKAYRKILQAQQPLTPATTY